MLNPNFTKRINVVLYLKGLKTTPYVRIIIFFNENQICQANDNMYQIGLQKMWGVWKEKLEIQSYEFTE